MAARHSPTTKGGFRFYTTASPPELMVLTRAGKRVSRANSEKRYQTKSWPAHRNLALDGGHRMP